MLCRIEYVGTATGGCGWARHTRSIWHCLRGRLDRTSATLLLEAVVGVVLHALELHFDLLIAVLQLLDGASELTQRVFHAVEPD